MVVSSKPCGRSRLPATPKLAVVKQISNTNKTTRQIIKDWSEGRRAGRAQR